MRTDKGFTLVELSVSSAILGICAVLISGAFHAGTSGYRNIEKNINNFHAARVILTKLNKELKNSFAYAKNDSAFNGSDNELSFFTLSGEDYCFINYKFENGKLTKKIIKNGEIKKDADSQKKKVISYRLSSLNFKYGYIGAANNLEWKDKWKGGQGLPVVVKADIGIENNEKFNRLIALPLFIKQ